MNQGIIHVFVLERCDWLGTRSLERGGEVVGVTFGLDGRQRRDSGPTRSTFCFSKSRTPGGALMSMTVISSAGRSAPTLASKWAVIAKQHKTESAMLSARRLPVQRSLPESFEAADTPSKTPCASPTSLNILVNKGRRDFPAVVRLAGHTRWAHHTPNRLSSISQGCAI